MDLAPLFALCVRTPRLELRLPMRAELVELRKVAAAGIHPPEEMPFAVAWTDDPELREFLPYHKRLRREWRPDCWRLELAVWAEGELAGAQGVGSTDFAQTRTVETGSWLGRRYQGQGIGREMRTAVLELAFDGLGAERAMSGYVDGNEASRRVSEKLGYRVSGRSTVSPRGEPVGQTDVELTRGEWRPPFAVEIERLEPALPLFGI